METKRPGREADHPSPSSAEDKHDWNCGSLHSHSMTCWRVQGQLYLRPFTHQRRGTCPALQHQFHNRFPPHPQWCTTQNNLITMGHQKIASLNSPRITYRTTDLHNAGQVALHWTNSLGMLQYLLACSKFLVSQQSRTRTAKWRPQAAGLRYCTRRNWCRMPSWHEWTFYGDSNRPIRLHSC
jgi:hypothetical protein